LSTTASADDQGAEFAGQVADQGLGLLVSIVLPDGGQLGLYQRRHPTAFDR